MATGLQRKQASNFVGKFLRNEFEEYFNQGYSKGAVFGDMAKVLGCTKDALDNWYDDRNGVKHIMCEKLAFLFQMELDEIVDSGVYDAPANPPAFDAVAFAKHTISATNATAIGGDRFKVEDLRRELRDAATEYLRAVGKLNDPLEPAKAPIGDRMPKPEPIDATPPKGAVECPQPMTPRPVAEVPQTLTQPEERNQIQLFLHQAEKFRANNNLEWFLDGNRLRARRVVTEEF